MESAALYTTFAFLTAIIKDFKLHCIAYSIHIFSPLFSERGIFKKVTCKCYKDKNPHGSLLASLTEVKEEKLKTHPRFAHF